MKKNILSSIAIFVGSFLVFGVQPMVGNTLLPFFGGTAAVWTVCLCAFQVLLLAGYFYAHLLSKYKTNLKPHLGLLLISAAWTAFVSFKYKLLAQSISTFSYPALGALIMVLIFVGIPYTLLSSNASLIQSLASTGKNDRSVYKLYAISNIGSFCGLLAYPFLIEPKLAISTQWLVFSIGILLYTIMVGFLSLKKTVTEAVEENTPVETTVADTPTQTNPKVWLFLSALSCFLLNGISAHLCNDITPLPLMWAVMLALYLLSWTFGFTDRGSRLGPLTGLIAMVLAGFAAWHIQKVTGEGFYIELAIGCLLILFGGWTIHARLYRLRPAESQLTKYYLMIAVGGAIGGTAASLVAPAIFSIVFEYPIALTLIFLPSLYEIFDWLVRMDDKTNGALNMPRHMDWKFPSFVLSVFFIIVCYCNSNPNGINVIYRARNFYGTSRVVREVVDVIGGTDYVVHAFEHGTTRHGQQPLDPKYYRKGAMYFGPHAGGLSINKHPNYTTNKPMRVALAGMGIGTLATYARKGDYYRFYEINPQVVEIASNKRLFRYVSDCEGTLDIVVDDARRALERERDANEEKWDVIIIDVFSGDSIPPHLATKEAFQLYLDRLAPGGIISMHITNWHLSLSPMVKAAAKEFGLHLQGFGCWADKWSIGSYWVYFTREKADFFIEGKHGRVNFDKIEDIPMMTDDKHSLLPYLSTKPMPDFE